MDKKIDDKTYSASGNKLHDTNNKLLKKNNLQTRNMSSITQNSDKKNIFIKKSDTLISKKNVSSKNTIHYKKNAVNILKKNKITTSNRLMVKKMSAGQDLKKIVNLSKLSDVNTVVEYNVNLRNKKDQRNNKNRIIKNSKDKKFLKKHKYRVLHQDFIKPKKHVVKKIFINQMISILELSKKMSIKSTELIKKIMSMGNVVTENQIIDQETAQLIIEEMGHKAILKKNNNVEEIILQETESLNRNSLKTIRPPVVTIMGHVDHGKTSLLDYIRSTKIASHEAGGITQHIGAYYVKTKGGLITFLDTPGHAAFTAMRARGVQITDIVVLVVAGDDGVKPQTIEAIQHAKSAGVPVLVAINKIDKPEANPERIKKELMKYEIMSEELGGETIFVNISAITGQGIDELLHAILLQSEILELSARTSGMANGVVIEARLDKKRGPITTVLIREGKLEKGDNILCGVYYGKVRAMKDSFGVEVKYAGPSIPIEILGLSGIPTSGDIFYTVENEKKAREIALYRTIQLKEKKIANVKKIDVHDMFKNLNKNESSILYVILKSDVKGSLEAVTHVIQNLSNQHICIKIISANVGNITETDVAFAVATHAIIIGFNVEPNILAKRAIKTENIDARYYSVIYHLIDDIKLIVSGMMSPKYKMIIIGSAEIRDIFKPTKSIFVAGCMVIHGIIKRSCPIRILRNKNIIYKGELESLRRFKEDVKEVGVGKECGIGIKNYNDICIGDVIESFNTIEIKN
ncbi:Translation initiation factor IF-2 [isoform beta] [Buchnera aphidicola (Takecallis arundicolens)]